MGEVSRKELEALRKALARILQEENPLPPHEQEAREAELSRRLSSDDSHDSAQSLDSQDLSIMSRLFSQVHHFMEGKESIPTENVKRPDVHERDVEIDKNMVDTVVEIASAAAEAAKAAAASSGKNLEVMETLLSNSEKNSRLDKKGTVEASADERSQQQPSIDKEIIRRLERQNRITHWVLGFMVVATAVWRFKMVSMFLGVRKTFSNPIQAFGAMVVDGFKGNNKEDSNGGGRGFHKARTGFPSFLGGEEKEVAKTTEKTESSTTEEFKIGEAITFSFDNLMAASGFSDKQGNEDTSAGPREEGSSKD